MEFKVVFHHTNKAVELLVGNFLNKEFVERREIAVDYWNQRYEEWNDEFNRLYPGVNGEDERYNKFISNKMQPGINKANEASIGANLIKLELGEDCDVYGWCEKAKDRIWITLR